MAGGKNGESFRSVRNSILLFGFLLVLSLIFFSLVRDNSFWQSGDYLFLNQALDIEQSWENLFVSAPQQPFQPLVKAVFYLEYKLFGMDAAKFYLFNILIHSINALLVYFLVVTLLRDRLVAILSSLLFACAVGNYGKAVMVVSGISDLLITLLTLLTLLFYFKNDLENEGRIKSFWFLGSVLFFVLSLLSKATSFSILGCLVAFHFFFRMQTRKRLLNRTFITITLVALAALIGKLLLLQDTSASEHLVFSADAVLRNFANYLVRMIFPIHASKEVADSGPIVRFIYKSATEIRFVTFLCILSYSVFGFLFANRTIRFFIAWMYITVIPFCFFDFPRDWLNIQYLYLVSVGFIMILSAGTVSASRLLYHRHWRRLIPYTVPALFVFLSQFIIFHLDRNYEQLAASPEMQQMKSDLLLKHESMPNEASKFPKLQ